MLPFTRVIVSPLFTGITEECNKLSPIIYAAMMDTGEKVVEYLLRSDCVYLSDKIFGANLLAAQLRGEKQLEYFVKAVEMRNEGWKDFNYAAYIEKHGTERQPRVIGRSSPPGYRDMSVCIYFSHCYHQHCLFNIKELNF